MRHERKYLVINYNKKLKKQVHITFYHVKMDDFGKTFVNHKEIREYNNIYHYINNFAKQTISYEINEGYEILEQKTQEDILTIYKNMQF